MSRQNSVAFSVTPPLQVPLNTDTSSDFTSCVNAGGLHHAAGARTPDA